MIGVTKNCVGAWETGRNLPDILTVNDLSLMFKIPIDYFLKDDSFGVGEQSVGYHTSVAEVIRLTDREILTINKLRSMNRDLRNAFETILGVKQKWILILLHKKTASNHADGSLFSNNKSCLYFITFSMRFLTINHTFTYL